MTYGYVYIGEGEMKKSENHFQLGYRAEVTENAVVDNAVVIRSNPTCPQCRKLQTEIARLKNLVSEYNLGPITMKPRKWVDTWAETPDKISPKESNAFITRHAYNSSKEEERMRKEIQRLQRELQIRATEVQRLRGRGLQPRDGNTNRASRGTTSPLADAGEQYNALYLQEWKTAFSSLSMAGVKQEEIIDTLLNIVKQCFSECSTLASSQLDSIIASSTIKNVRDSAQSVQRDQGEVRGAAAQYQRSLQQQQMPNVQKNIYPKVVTVVPANSKASTDTKVSTYINKCIRVCWNLCIQDVNVTFDSSVTRFSRLNPDVYRYFTQEGDLVDYIVWPAVLSEGGRVVARGVAEATSRQQ